MHRIFIGALIFFLFDLTILLHAESAPSIEEMTPETILQGEEEIYKVGYIKGTDFVYEDRPNHKTGYGYEYMEFLSNYAHCKFEYVEFEDWGELSDKLQSGEIDIVPGMPGDYRKLKDAVRTDHVVARFPMELVTKEVKPEMKIGNWAMNYATPALAGVARGEGFSYELVNYPHYKDMIKAYNDNEIDGYVDAMIDPHKSHDVLAVFDRQSYRLSVNENRKELLTRLNLAMDQMLLNQPNIRDKLNTKYYRADGNPLILSRSEKDYLAGREKLRAAIFMYRQPYAYYNEDNELVGVMPEIIRRISYDLGVEIEIVETKNLTETRELMEKGEIDFIVDAVCDYSWAQSFNMKPTQSFLSMEYIPVTRKNESLPATAKVACCRDMFYTRDFIEPLYPEDKRVYVDTLEDSILAVEDGRADIAYVHRNLIGFLVENTQAYNLEENAESVFSEPISLGVYSGEDPKLWHILNKEIGHIDSDWVRDMLNKNRQTVFHMTPKYLVYHHPVRVFLVMLAITAIVTALLIHRNRMKKKHFELVEHMAYTDLRYDLPNVSWLEREVPLTMEKLSEAGDNSETFFAVFSMSSSVAVTEDFGRRLINKQFCSMAKSLAQSEHVLLTAAGIDVEHLICFCKANSVEEVVEWARASIKEYSQTGLNSSAHEKTKIVLHMQAGISHYSSSTYVQQAIDRAVTACHQNSSDDVRVFDDKMEEHLKLQHEIESRMEQALNDGEFQAWYQPKYDIRSKRIIGAEALVRWISPDLGFMPPGKFIPLFEENGFVIPVDYYLLEKTFQLQKERLEAGKKVVPISVNQSRLHMTEDGYLEKMKALVDKYKLPEGLIELEVTETMFGDFDSKSNQGKAASIVRGLHDLGFTISIDDFGSGYSSFMMLGSLPMDVMKIDRSLLTGADTSKRMSKILGNVIKLGQSLKMMVICEGIETVEEENLLLKLGCYYGQGFLNAKPMPVDDFIKFFEKRNEEVGAAF